MRWIKRAAGAVKYAALLSAFCLPALPFAQTTGASGGPLRPSPASAPAPNSGAPSAYGTSPVSPAQPTGPRFLVVLDAAHGGTDPGALLGTTGPEKDYTLAFALRLHALLTARGIRSTLTRGTDATLDGDARAEIDDRARASACILLHATATGDGVHLFTSSLAPASGADKRHAFLPWRTAQASYATESLRLESDMNSALTDAHVPTLMGRTSLVPLDSLACPAVALEVAPLDAATPLTDAAYQQKVIGALASALAAWRNDWRQQR